MATMKRKTQAKRAAKTAARTQTYSARAAAAPAKETAKQAAGWAQQGAAKLYKLPFTPTDVNEATKKAAASVQSATENAMRAGADFWQNFFNPQQQQQQLSQWTNMFAGAGAPSLPGFNGKSLQNFGRESAGQLQRGAENSTRLMNEASALSRENAEACVQCSNIAVNVSKDVGAELVNYANRSFAQNVELSKQVLGCRTLNDLFDLSSRLVKTNLDGFFSESVKVSEMLFEAASNVSEPLNERLSETTERLTKVLAA